MNILIVDDEPIICEVLVDFLARQGHHVLSAGSAAQAISTMENSPDKLDILITDICMPQEDGFSFLSKMKKNYPEVHVILMSGNVQNLNVSSIIEKGGSAFLRKPIKLSELEILINQISKYRHDKGLINSLNDRIQKESNDNFEMIQDLQFARRIHSRIFPRDYSWLKRSQVHIRYIPMASVGGDYIDIKPYGKNKFLFWISDVSGHGTPAAFCVIAFKTWFSSLPFKLMPSTIFADAEKVLHDIFPEEFFATAVCGIYDEKERTLVYSLAGHPDPFIISQSGEFRLLEGCGTALGFSGCPEWHDYTETLEENDILIAYTDGVTQTPDLLIKSLIANKETRSKIIDKDLPKLVTHIIDVNNEISPNRAYADDLAIFTLSPAKPQKLHEVPSLEGKTILLVFQDPELYENIEPMLQNYACNLLTLSITDLDYAGLTDSTPDAIIIELSQFNDLGYSTLVELRQQNSNLPILVISDNESEEQLRICIKHKASGFLIKPFESDNFLDAVRNAMQFSEENDIIEIDDINPDWMDVVISSSPVVLNLLNRYLNSLSRQPLPSKVKDEIVYCIKEIAGNAIEWGNLHHPELKVRISTVILAGKAMIKITDEGSGFNVKEYMNSSMFQMHQDSREENGKRAGGFGLTIVQEIMDSVIFNEKGNGVLLTKSF